MGQFLGYYSQYTLEDVATMDVDSFMFLVGAMLDNTHPDTTMPVRDLAAQRIREKLLARRDKGRR